MTYVLLYTDCDGRPKHIQGSVAEINEQFRELWQQGYIDRDEWDNESYGPWQLLGIEDDRLTPMGNVECHMLPYFEVH
jgi:hypothetical protein